MTPRLLGLSNTTPKREPSPPSKEHLKAATTAESPSITPPPAWTDRYCGSTPEQQAAVAAIRARASARASPEGRHAIALQRVWRGRMARAWYARERDALSYDLWLSYFLRTKRYRLAMRMGWPQLHHMHAASARIQAAWRGQLDRRRWAATLERLNQRYRRRSRDMPLAASDLPRLDPAALADTARKSIESLVISLNESIDKFAKCLPEESRPEDRRMIATRRAINEKREERLGGGRLIGSTGKDATEWQTWYRADSLFLYRHEPSPVSSRAQDDEAVAAAAALWLDRNGLSQPVWGEQPLPLPQQQAAAPSEATLSRLENRYGGGAMPVFKPGASTIGADNLVGARGGDMPVATFHTVTTMSMRHVR